MSVALESGLIELLVQLVVGLKYKVGKHRTKLLYTLIILLGIETGIRIVQISHLKRCLQILGAAAAVHSATVG